jgi:hypothetical protein
MPISGFEKLMLLLPAVAVVVGGPEMVQDCERPFGVATTRPAGKLSVNVTSPAKSLPLGFVTVKVSVVVPFKGIDDALNDLAIVGIAAWAKAEPVNANVASTATIAATTKRPRSHAGIKLAQAPAVTCQSRVNLPPAWQSRPRIIRPPEPDCAYRPSPRLFYVV